MRFNYYNEFAKPNFKVPESWCTGNLTKKMLQFKNLTAMFEMNHHHFQVFLNKKITPQLVITCKHETELSIQAKSMLKLHKKLTRYRAWLDWFNSISGWAKKYTCRGKLFHKYKFWFPTITNSEQIASTKVHKSWDQDLVEDQNTENRDRLHDLARFQSKFKGCIQEILKEF